MSIRRLTTTAAGSLVLLTLLTGCGSSLSGSSTCADFMKASSEEQQHVVNELATKYKKPDYTTPLGAPEVPYYCSQKPDTTLDEFFKAAG